jgi:hypothetical protein
MRKPAVVLRLRHLQATYGIIGVGLWLGLESTDLTLGQRRAISLAVMIPVRSKIAKHLRMQGIMDARYGGMASRRHRNGAKTRRGRNSFNRIWP